MSENKNIVIKTEFQNLLPRLTDEQFAGLEQSILAHGCLQPLITWNGILIDGHHRYAACCKHGINFTTKEMQFKDELEAMYWCWLNQKNRRNLTAYEASAQALKFEPIIKEKAKEKQVIGGELKGEFRNELSQKSVEALQPIDTQKELAKLANVSHDTIAKVKAIERAAPEELKQKLLSQELSINQAYNQIKKEEKLKLVEAKVAKFKQQAAPIGFTDIYTITKKYNIIYADPPWKCWESGQRSANLHYQTMNIEEICHLPVKNIADNNCILFLWVIYPLLREALNVIESWGFKYSTCGFCWIKKNPCGTNFFGLGNWTRSNSELCLIATRGCITRVDNTIPQVIESVREAHSKKPAQVRNLIVRLVGDLPKIELFARQTAAGWDCWGNEVN